MKRFYKNQKQKPKTKTKNKNQKQNPKIKLKTFLTYILKPTSDQKTPK